MAMPDRPMASKKGPPNLRNLSIKAGLGSGGWLAGCSTILMGSDQRL